MKPRNPIAKAVKRIRPKVVPDKKRRVDRKRLAQEVLDTIKKHRLPIIELQCDQCGKWELGADFHSGLPSLILCDECYPCE